MTAVAIGMRDWSGSRDEEGHRTYKAMTLVKCTSYDDGPDIVMFAAGLPAVGSAWDFGNGTDAWAFCLPTMTVQRHQPREGEKGWWWRVDQNFSTKPTNRCQNTNIENPLAEPPKLSGSFARYKERLRKRRDGSLILSSSHEEIQGLERDANRPSVVIERNFGSLGLSIFAPMINTVNSHELWGLGPRKIMLVNASWTRNVYGTCGFYYTVRYEFEVRYDGFDLTDIADVGYKTYIDKPGNSRDNPKHFEVWKGDYGENTPVKMLLDGNGDALDDPTDPSFIDDVEWAEESNFYALGIPASL